MRADSLVHLRQGGRVSPAAPITFTKYPHGTRLTDGRHRITVARERGESHVSGVLRTMGPRGGVTTQPLQIQIAQPKRRPSALRQAAGRKAAVTRSEQDQRAAQEIPLNLHDVWFKVRSRIKTPKGKRKAEAFLEWVSDHPEKVQALRLAESQEFDKQIIHLQRHCSRAVNRAARDLKKKKFDTFAQIDDQIADELQGCAKSLGPAYDPAAVEMNIRLAETGAPF